MLSKIETLEALRVVAATQKEYADTLKVFEAYTDIQIVGKFSRNELQIFRGLAESGLDLKQTPRINSDGTPCKEYPTAYSIDIDGILFFELSKDEMREGEMK